jgi:hypothetical protein
MSRKRPNYFNPASSPADSRLSHWQVVFSLTSFCLLALLAGCSTQSLRSITLNPAGPLTLAAGQTAQFQALGAYIQGTHAPVTMNITTSAKWTSSNTAVATVNASGLVTANSAGTTTITASATGLFGLVTATSNIVVTGGGSSGGTGQAALTSITILPGSQSVTSPGETVQFIAIGTYTADPTTQDLTSQVTWSSSDVSVAKIDASGLATYVGGQTSTIIASYAQSTSSPVITATSTITFATGTSPAPTVILPTLTIFKVGSGASTATVTGSYTGPAGSTITAINCTAGASNTLCTGAFPAGTVVTLNTPNNGSTTPIFGGWSSNCLPVTGNPYSCTISLPAPSSGSIGNYTVGAIFD